MSNTQSKPWKGLEGLGSTLRRLRLARGLTQQALAKRAGISTIYVQALERGERRSPSLPTLNRLAQALGVQIRLRFSKADEDARGR